MLLGFGNFILFTILLKVYLNFTQEKEKANIASFTQSKTIKLKNLLKYPIIKRISKKKF